MLIYKITNIKNKKLYIGQTIRSTKQRKSEHFRDADYGDPRPLYQAIRKYGKENFIIEQIDLAQTQEELNQKEEFWIKELKAHITEWGYNLDWSSKGIGTRSDETKKKISEGNKGKKISEETKRKISLSNKGRFVGEKHYFYGKTHKEETKLKISSGRKDKCLGKDNPFYGKAHTDEFKQKMSQIKKGCIPANKGKPGLSGTDNPFYGKNHSEETKKKMSQNPNRKHPGSANPSAILNEDIVYQIKMLLNKNIYTQKQIADMFNTSQSCIWRIRVGKNWKHVQLKEG